ncbi:hypothetical protein FVE85_9609 [Porphyridium purpureum]|uniref:SnoaL-like domain-containing protein n=1 Tax=Porphyridium purpureum TaxID=35688 RepID=A0A5J4YGC7_PORPP|nr:hypothetical protein FVE85_9609 [Porphyridium purpureum]|eukprot:POR4498..scf267_23
MIALHVVSIMTVVAALLLALLWASRDKVFETPLSARLKSGDASAASTPAAASSSSDARHNSHQRAAPAMPTHDSVSVLLQNMDRLFNEYLVDNSSTLNDAEFLAQLPLAPDASVILFGERGVGVEAVKAFKRSVHTRVAAPDAHVTRILTRVSQLTVSGMHYTASHLALWFSSTGTHEWVPAVGVGSLRADGKDGFVLASYSYLVDVNDQRALFDSMNGYMHAEQVVQQIMQAFERRDTVALSRHYSDDVTYHLVSVTKREGKDDAIQFYKNVTNEFAIDSAHVWSVVTARDHPSRVKKVEDRTWMIEFDSFELMGRHHGCFTVTDGVLLLELNAANKVRRVDFYADLNELSIGMAKCRFLAHTFA